MTTTTDRAERIFTMKHRRHVAFWLEKTYGAMTGELVCKHCFLGGDREADAVTPLDLGEACKLAVDEGQPPACDRCGNDIRDTE